MYTRALGVNELLPREKMTIRNLDSNDSITVLYNPAEFTRSRSVNYARTSFLNSDAPLTQFISGGGEVLQFELFFDSASAVSEIGGTSGDKNSFLNARGVSALEKNVDVRKYTKKITELLCIQKDKHRPPLLLVKWSSLEFTGFLTSCEQKYLKFNPDGLPIRATLSCQFAEYRKPSELAGRQPPESPDTTKYHTVQEKDSLWALSGREYGDCSEWRAIAKANGLVNPRRLKSGTILRIPALKR